LNPTGLTQSTDQQIQYLINIQSKWLEGNFQHTFFSRHSLIGPHMKSFDHQLKANSLTAILSRATFSISFNNYSTALYHRMVNVKVSSIPGYGHEMYKNCCKLR